MSNLGLAQEMAPGGPGFTPAERAKIADFSLPGDTVWGRSGYYARKPTESTKDWITNHSAKLAGLLRAESDGR